MRKLLMAMARLIEEGGELPHRPCVGSGFCCKMAPCPYGAADPITGWCIHLVPWPDDDLGIPRYRCGRYEHIIKQPDADMVPAFGGGCGSTLFNDDRDAILHALDHRTTEGGHHAEGSVEEGQEMVADQVRRQATPEHNR